MSAFSCPDCGSFNLTEIYDDYFECEDCGKVSAFDECQVKPKKSSKLGEKVHFDDGSGNFPRERKRNHRDNVCDPFEDLDDVE